MRFYREKTQKKGGGDKNSGLAWLSWSPMTPVPRGELQQKSVCLSSPCPSQATVTSRLFWGARLKEQIPPTSLSSE